MVTVKSPSLSSFAVQRNNLLNLLFIKAGAFKTTTVNEVIDNRLRIEPAHVTGLLNSIETKFKKCETLYYLYFEDADHSVLSGNPINLPVEVDCSLIDGTATIKHYFKVDDYNSYKEIIDSNFQTFILTVAALYENLVLLAEIFQRKVIVYLRRPPSLLLHDYLSYLELLISLGYRDNDKLNACITSSKFYFDRYLAQINQLRNMFIHGYSINLETDGANYFVAKTDKGFFAPKSPALQLDIFTKEVLDQSKTFIINLMTALKESGKHYKKTIPA